MIKLLHSRFLGLLLIFLFASQANYAQDVIHCWDFNGTTPFSSPINSTNRVTSLTTDDGEITHNIDSPSSGAGSDLNACAGSASGSAFLINAASNNAKFIDLKFSSEGYENLILSFFAQRNASGFTNNLIQYSTDGTNFTNLPSLSFTPVTSPGSVQTFNISNVAPAIVNDQPNLVIRIVTGTASTGGTTRIDNIKLEGTLVNPNDKDSSVINPTTQVPASTIIAANTTTLADAAPIFSFDIQDLGTSDGLATNVTQMRFVQGPLNTADWPTLVNSLVLKDGSDVEVDGSFGVFGGEIIFTPDAPVSVTDNTTENFTIEAILNQTGIVDGAVIQLQIPGVGADFLANLSGSDFATTFPNGDITGNEITINVVATELRFKQQPTDVDVLLAMSPDVEVSLTDVNGNIDTSNTTTVELTSDGNLANTSISEAAIDGIATFSNIVHNTPGFGLTLTASTLDPFTVISSSFNVFNFDTDSEVIAPTTQIAGSTIEAATASAVPVLEFEIVDAGSGDAEPTNVTQMRFEAGGNNTADWSATLQEFIIRDAASNPIAGTATISENEVIFTPDTPVIIADATTESFTAEVILITTGNITDQSVVQFQIPAISSGFLADFSGSIFSSPLTGGDIVGNDFLIDVVATQITFLQQPSDVEVNVFMTPSVQVAYTDINGNVDTSIITDINLTSSGGTLVNPFTAVTPVDGITTLPNIAYSAEATGLTLTAVSTESSISPNNSIVSNPFDVGTPVIAIQDFDGTQPEWLYDASVSTFDNGWDTGGFFGVINSADASPLASGSFVDNIFGVNNLNGTETLDFVSVNISGYTNVELSFDWEAIGNVSSTESISYQIFEDGSPQGVVNLYTGDGTILSGSGTVSETITSETQEVSLVVTVQDNGADSYIGLDNFKLTGDSNARDTDIIEPIAGQVPAGTLIADVNDEILEAVEVFGFEVVDSGNFDTDPTDVTRLRFVPGEDNTADWATVLQGISISDGTNTLAQGDQSETITTDEILVDITGDPNEMFTVGDGTTKTYTLSVFLNTSGITDQEIIQLAIADGNENQLASSDGSIFSSDITAFEGNEFLIDVVGNGLEFIVQPTTTVVNVNMDPDVEVANTDANGNFDLDNVGETVTITSSGTLTVSPNSATFGAGGIANFGQINHTQPGFDLELTAASGVFANIVSDLFDITATRTLLISEVVDPSDNSNGRYVELFNMDTEALDLGVLNHYLHNETTGTSVQLLGVIPAKSYYVISFVDNATFNGIYGRDADFEAPGGLSSDGQDAYYLSFEETEQSVLDVYGDLTESGTTPTDWEFTDTRAYRNIPTVRESNSTYTATEWTLETSASTSDATIGFGDNDFIYSGDWTISGLGDPEGGSFTGSNPDKSIFVESGTATLSIANTISDVVVRDGATLIIEDAITLNGDFANFTTSGNGKVTFRSTDTQTAVLGPFDGPDQQLVGTNYEIERYIPDSNRAFRYLSSSVFSTGSIRDNWQEGVNNTLLGDANNQNPNDGYGIHITGSTDGSSGFDATETGNPSMYEWGAIGQAWTPIANTNSTTLAPGKAYALLIRGSRAATLNSNTAFGPSTTLRTTGRLVVGSRGVSEVSNVSGEFNFIGNPYQAKVNMTTLLGSGNSSGVSSQYVYIYDPTLGSRGGYATVELSSGDAFQEDRTTPSTSNANQFLEPNQAFFVETVTSGASPAVVFNESYKTTDVANNTTFSVPEETSNLLVNLYSDDLEAKAVDGVKVKFRPGANNAKDTLDATKVWNYNESVAINRNPNYMSIETRDLPTAQDSIPLYFGFPSKLAYRWEINPKHFTSAEAYLYDKYLETAIELPSDQVTNYSFTLDNSIPESTATDRFVIRFDNVTLGGDEFELDTSIVVYPNPVTSKRFGIAQRAFEGSDIDLQLFDLQGRLVMNQKIDNAPNVEVMLDDTISSGVYILKLSDDSKSQSLKLIVE